MTQSSKANRTGTPFVKRSGTIVLARHGRPDTDKSHWIDSKGYYNWWRGYDESGLDLRSPPPQNLLDEAMRAHRIFASDLRRAQETAAAVADDKPVTYDPVFTEAPLPPPPFPGFIRMRPPHWDVWSRSLWWLGYSGGFESRAHAETRAFAAVKRIDPIAREGENVLVCAHGWFNRMMRPALVANGWNCIYDGRDDYWSFRRYERAREQG
ncbi:MAG: histidine phosphatase family protein [Robiginitomaculum sp.]|nr:MAG: histidine phosphatase family protein [Robiginitomaculum sp.]